MKLGLGTVQFGLNYGISNKKGQVPIEEVQNILGLAAQHGIEILDTASGYGSSEEVLGKSLPPDHKFRIVTKTANFSGSTIMKKDLSTLDDLFNASLLKMKVDSVYGLLLHDADNLFLNNGALLIEKMNELKERGRVTKIGVSVYTSGQIERVLNSFQVDIIQLPLNVMDQRLVKNGGLKKIKENGIEIHARSVFLQGLLLMDPDKLHPYFNDVRGHLKEYHAFLSAEGITPVEGALGFVTSLKEIDCILAGVSSFSEFREIINGSDVWQSLSCNFSRFHFPDARILNPAMWNLN